MKSRSFAFRRAVLSLLALSVVLFNFASCKTEDDDPEYVNYSLFGSWTSTYSEVFTITTTSLSNAYGTSDCYAGDNLVVLYTNDDATAGYIYIKYTRAMNSDYTYSESAPDVGKWYAVAFKDLTSSSVSLSGAYGAVSSTSTLEEAISTFTVANGYFASYSECAKSE